ncbi:Wiskott-Aldrich syndrome protein family member 3 [Bos mutus]|uniref:Wiskott-Aldrich syndrome protein family member n=1 Tax=Bos mutus TaxID=72004 RepID=L8I952_9CETA|nr:Wiskott-Aldrich syndrome protein family member 3 [Bos mutus]
MPLVKRNIEPRHLCRGALPEGITSELECVTNSTLAAIIRQLSSLSKHAEDIFGELFNEANNFYIRANSLQDRIDRLAVKVTQLDSTVEEVSLQDINMKKAFKSSTVQDQQVVSKNSIPNPVADIYNQSDKPPPLNILTPYRDDKKDGLKFYTDPSYFFDLWKEKMLQDTEDKRKEKRRQKEQKRIDGTTREVKKVRKARNRRQEWNMMAYDKELRPDTRLSQSAHHGASSEGSLSPDTRSHASDVTDYSYPATPNHSLHPQPGTPSYGAGDGPAHGPAAQAPEHEFRPPSASARHLALNRPQQPPPPPPQATEGPQAPAPMAPADYGCPALCRRHLFQWLSFGARQQTILNPITVTCDDLWSKAWLFASCSVSHDSVGSVLGPPPPPGPPGAGSSLSSSPMHAPPGAEAKRQEAVQPPVSDARSDLLAAIRMGIQLKKVQEQREQEAKREPVGNDVATILSRRIAVEYSDSDDDSEFDENDWSD